MSDERDAESRALALLSALCMDLVRVAGPSVQVCLRDAIPRLEVTGCRSGVVVDVRVDLGGREFVFRPSHERHPTTNIPGAALAVLDLVSACEDPVFFAVRSGRRGKRPQRPRIGRE